MEGGRWHAGLPLRAEVAATPHLPAFGKYYDSHEAKPSPKPRDFAHLQNTPEFHGADSNTEAAPEGN